MLSWFCTTCTATSHPTQRARLGKPSSGADMLARASEPGPIEFEAHTATNWRLDQKGLIKLKHPKALAAGVCAGDVLVHTYFYRFTHPGEGVFLIDSGASRQLRDTKDDPLLSNVVKKAMRLGDMEVVLDTKAWLEQQRHKPAGIFLTHLHADHLLGLRDLPADTPLFVGPEPRSRRLVHMLSHSSTNRLLHDFGALDELAVETDPSQMFSGVIDLFGDSSAFAIHVPGHTAGSMAFLLRTTKGPVLVTGDAARSAWGWEHGVPSHGIGNQHAGRNAESLERLRAFAAKLPRLEVHLGHQRIGQHVPLLKAA
jgi:glyoxylase-like metal-dependent hydrolase (beta-lactamase superfamily II)